MKKALYLLLFTVAACILLPGCQKLFDYIKDNPGEAKKYCKINKLKWRNYGYTEAKVTYNAAGNPVSLLIEGNNGAGVIFDYRFRYDNINRITDCIRNVHGSPGAMQWNRYSYPTKNRIIDTVFYYSGLVTDVIPPNANTAIEYTVYAYDLDNNGKVYKTTQFTAEGDVDNEVYSNYTAQGNLILEYVTYDDKMNPYLTHPVWPFVYNDYSLNNRLYTNEHPFQFNNKIVAYNDWGLPTKLTANEALLFGSRYDTLEIEYQCSK